MVTFDDPSGHRPVAADALAPRLARLAVGVSALKALPLLAMVVLAVWLVASSVPGSLETTCAEGDLCGEGQGLALFIALIVFAALAFAVPLLGLQILFARRGSIIGVAIISGVLTLIDTSAVRFLVNDWRDPPGPDRELIIAVVIAGPLVLLQAIVTVWASIGVIAWRRTLRPQPR